MSIFKSFEKFKVTAAVENANDDPAFELTNSRSRQANARRRLAAADSTRTTSRSRRGAQILEDLHSTSLSGQIGDDAHSDVVTGSVSEDFRPTSHPKISRFLSSHTKLEALVDEDGTLYYVHNPQHIRDFSVLRRLVAQVYSSQSVHNAIQISPIEYQNVQKFLAQSQADSEDDSEYEQNLGNTTVNYVLGQAIENDASDIYIDIRQESALISFRTFGLKTPFETMSRDEGLNMVRSLFTSGNQAYEEVSPADFTSTHIHRGKEYRVRGSSLPEVRGSSVVLRVRDPGVVLPLDQCGYTPVQIEHINRMCSSPGGMIIISGETNSGKSSTLATLMMELPHTEKIIELADPVEVEMEHVSHVSFKRAMEEFEEERKRILSTLVRQNPDTLILGEIRDEMTAESALNMAIQGKRVYSTVHAQTAMSTIPRLRILGIDTELLQERHILAGIINQNLCGVLCQECCRETANSEGELKLASMFADSYIRFRNEIGCSQCSHGIVGQTLVAEVYPLTLDRSEYSHSYIKTNEFSKIESHMQHQFGVINKHQHAALKIAQGTIDPVETERVIGEFAPEDVSGIRYEDATATTH